MKVFKYSLLLFLGFSFACYSQTPSSDFTFIQKINLDGPIGWDYLTMDNDRLFVTNDDRVHVIDVKSNTEIDVILGLKGVHGVTFATEFNKGFISNGKDSSVTVFDYKTLKVLNTIKVGGKKADAIFYDKFSKRVFVYCNGSDFAMVIDAKTDHVLKKIILGEGAEFAMSNEKGLIYNNNEALHQITVVDCMKMEIVNSFPLSPNLGPTGLAIDLKNNLLFSACRVSKTLVVVNALNGKIVSTLPIGAKCDGIVFDAEKGLIISANGEGTATIIKQESPSSYKIVQTLKTEPRLRTISINKNNHRIYLSGPKLDGEKAIPNSFGIYVYGIE